MKSNLNLKSYLVPIIGFVIFIVGAIIIAISEPGSTVCMGVSISSIGIVLIFVFFFMRMTR